MHERVETAVEEQSVPADKVATPEPPPLSSRRTLPRSAPGEDTPTPVPAPVRSLRHPRRVLGAALALGGFAEVLFDGPPLGLSFPFFVALAFTTLGVLSGEEGWHGARRVRWLVVPALLFAAFVALRSDPQLIALNLLACAALTGLLVQGYSGELTVLDLRFWEVPGRALQGWLLGLGASPSLIQQSVDTRRAASAARAALGPALKAVGVTVPVVALFMALLASGDEAYARVLGHVLSHLSPGGGTLSSVAVVAGATLAIGGLFTHALRRRSWEPEPLVARGGRWLGALEASCLVYSLVAVFGLFAGVRFQELWVEHARLIPQAPGIGWGTYAREGFEQLAAAASLMLGLLVALPRIAMLDGVRRSFRIGASVLVALTLVILATAVNRLVACEEAYGYTVTRLFGHVFGFALAAVLVWRAVTVWVWPHRFAVGALAGALGWVLALDAINPDAFVVQKNLERFARTGRIDRSYNDLLLGK